MLDLKQRKSIQKNQEVSINRETFLQRNDKQIPEKGPNK